MVASLLCRQARGEEEAADVEEGGPDQDREEDVTGVVPEVVPPSFLAAVDVGLKRSAVEQRLQGGDGEENGELERAVGGEAVKGEDGDGHGGDELVEELVEVREEHYPEARYGCTASLPRPRGAMGLLVFGIGLAAFLELSWGSRSVVWRPSSVLRSNLACLTPILLAEALPRTPWASFLEAETK